MAEVCDGGYCRYMLTFWRKKKNSKEQRGEVRQRQSGLGWTEGCYEEMVVDADR